MDLKDLIHKNFWECKLPTVVKYKEHDEWMDMGIDHLRDKVGQFMKGLKKQGIKKGDHVILMAPNSPKWLIARTQHVWAV